MGCIMSCLQHFAGNTDKNGDLQTLSHQSACAYSAFSASWPSECARKEKVKTNDRRTTARPQSIPERQVGISGKYTLPQTDTLTYV